MKKTALALAVLFLTVFLFSLSGCVSILRWWDFVTGSAASEQPLPEQSVPPSPLEIPPNDQVQLAGQPDESRPLTEAAFPPAPESSPLIEQSAALPASPEPSPVVSPSPAPESSPVVASPPGRPEQAVSLAPVPAPPAQDSRQENSQTESSRTEPAPASPPVEQTVVSAPPAPPAPSPVVRQESSSPVPDQNVPPSRPQSLQPSGERAQNARSPAPPSLLSSYTVRWGDSLWSIAGNPRVYNNPYQWRRLYNANRRKLVNPNNPHLILPGTVLVIPRP